MSPRAAFCLLNLSLLLSVVSLSDGATPRSRPKGLLARVARDGATLQYVVELQQKTPLQKERLVLDVGGEFLWVLCNGSYKSSTYRPVRCRTALCKASGSIACVDSCFGPAEPGCSNDTCGVFPENTVTRTATGGELSQDVVALSSTDGRNPGARATVPRFAFSCAPALLLRGLAAGAAGMAGLGNARLALPAQLSAAFGFRRTFAVCLPAGRAPGVVFFGDGPYFFLPGREVSPSLRTPLLRNPKFPREYFVGVAGIAVNGKKIAVDPAKLKFDGEGRGGTKLSTVVAYTQAATSIYKALRDAFVAAAKNVPRVKPVKPFDTCYDAKAFGFTRVGPAVPTIDLVLQNNGTFWRIFGANSMVQVSDDVLSGICRRRREPGKLNCDWIAPAGGQPAAVRSGQIDTRIHLFVAVRSDNVLQLQFHLQRLAVNATSS